MAKIERLREAVQRNLDLNHVHEMMQSGWRLTGIEWERESADTAPEPTTDSFYEEVPYGLRVAADCRHLERDPREMEALNMITEMIVRDVPLSAIAQELNRQGYLMRDGGRWNALSVYGIFPRLIEVTPKIFSEEQWRERRPDMTRITWNS